MKKVRVCILRSAGTNCDWETAFAFAEAGASPESVHINELLRRQRFLDDYEILAIPGGFTYGDDLGAGKIFANELRFKLGDEIRAFVKSGKLVIGICNGFQILVKAGLLPGNPEFTQEASLVLNDSAKFEARWVYLRNPGSRCIWTRGLAQVIYLPVAHGEGKFVTLDRKIMERLKNNEQVALRYCDEKGDPAGYPYDPNGSQDHIAGITDESGRVFGLMPHPERHCDPLQNPRWFQEGKKEGDGIFIFRNGVDYARKNLLT